MSNSAGRRRLRSCGIVLTLVVCVMAPSESVAAKIVKFDPDGSVDTQPNGIDTKGAITGLYLKSNEGKPRGFLRSPDGIIATFVIRGFSCGTDPLSINRKGAIAGEVRDGSCLSHGFVRAADGSINTFDVPEAVQTYPQSINDHGMIAGAYRDSSDVLHGFLRTAAGKIKKFDPPNSTFTLPMVINNNGDIAGSYS